MWKPIETAPKDGTVIIIEDSFGHIQNYTWAKNVMGGCWKHFRDEETYSNPRFMKHWMPLPPPPEQITKSNENDSCYNLTNAADTSQNIEHTGD